MAEEILLNITPREVRIALIEDGITQEIHIERTFNQGIIGNIYHGKVTRVLPSLQASFVDIGLERAAFLHVADVSHDPNANIADLIRPGQELLVQVYKDQLGSKGARLTTHFTIPSRYLVLTPNNVDIAVSQKITDEAERARLINLVSPSKWGGFVFRTVAVGIETAEIQADKNFLESLWESVLLRAKKAKSCERVYEEIPIALRVLRDWVGYKIAKIWVDEPNMYAVMKRYAQQNLPDLAERLILYNDTVPLFDRYEVEEVIQKALGRNVYMRSGAYLVFDQTEAMTTIDVNTGSSFGQKKVEETIFNTNLEAVEVIARHIRLRNLGGIIIIDFIDMVSESQKTEVLDALKKAAAKDTARLEISEVSSLGLVQMTRKRIRESLEHILCVPCPQCQRRGSVKSFETVCYDIFREFRKILQKSNATGFTIMAAPSVIAYISEKESDLFSSALDATKTVQYRSEPTYGPEQFHILPL